MRVICIKDSIKDPRFPNCISTIKDSIYNVIDIKRLPFPYLEGDWYKLLETENSLHHHSLFREIDDISEEIEEIEFELTN